MTYKEINGDLFTAGSKPLYVHCISADFALGAGIAAEFARRGVKAELRSIYPMNVWEGVGYGLPASMMGGCRVYNLVTKAKCYDKPTLTTLQDALDSLKIYVMQNYVTEIVMPKIGCGLDKLNWSDVSLRIFDTFTDVDVNIIVYKKEQQHEN